jgi:NADPH-dependent curcumin reductase CurA
MTERTNRQWLLAKRPVGMVSAANFEFREVPAPVPGDGEVLVKNLFLSFDPAMRGWMEDRPSYIPPVAIGEVMRCGAVGQVVESNDASFPVGTNVSGFFGWQEYAIAGRGRAMPIDAGTPITWPISVLGITGLTAYFGMLEIGKPKAGETVVVSGAAGATGSIAAQIARIQGARAIGIAGGAQKCAWLVDAAKLDAAIDYKSEDVGARLAELCPNGIDVFFDNVGGPILEQAIDRIALRARIVLCGAISGYNEKEPPPGPRNLLNLVRQRARMEGLILTDFAPRRVEGVAKLTEWLRAGKLAHLEDIQEGGIENAPRTFLRLFSGQNFGKQLLRVGAPEGSSS